MALSDDELKAIRLAADQYELSAGRYAADRRMETAAEHARLAGVLRGILRRAREAGRTIG